MGFNNKRIILSLIRFLVASALLVALVVVLDVHYTTQQWAWFAAGVIVGRIILEQIKYFVRRGGV